GACDRTIGPCKRLKMFYHSRTMKIPAASWAFCLLPFSALSCVGDRPSFGNLRSDAGADPVRADGGALSDAQSQSSSTPDSGNGGGPGQGVDSGSDSSGNSTRSPGSGIEADAGQCELGKTRDCETHPGLDGQGI